jgi:hypothetical protein
MKSKMTVTTVLEITYENGTSEIKGFTKKDWAAFRRSKIFKTVLSKKKLCSISVNIKTL